MDFLSNGFHQLYSELDDDFLFLDQNLIHNYDSTNTLFSPIINTDENYNSFSNNIFGCDYHENSLSNEYSSSSGLDQFCYNNGKIMGSSSESSTAEDILELSVFHQSNPYIDGDIIKGIDLLNNLDCKMDQHCSSKIINSEESTLRQLEDNKLMMETTIWENNFLFNKYDIEIPSLLDYLPERTPLCNDSCDLFLKESSDNLNKFRPDKMLTTDLEVHEKNNLLEFEIINSESNDNLLNHSAPSSNMYLIPSDSEKVFPCTYNDCRKVYAKPAHLKAHIRRHLGDKPYVCNWPNCTWKFSRSDELARHRRSHSGIKPYKCTYCTKCFARSDHLSKHKKVHERKIAASKEKGIFIANLHRVRPGRKPKKIDSVL